MGVQHYQQTNKCQSQWSLVPRLCLLVYRNKHPHQFYLNLVMKTRTRSGCLRMNYSSNGVRNLTSTTTWKAGGKPQLPMAAMAACQSVLPCTCLMLWQCLGYTK